MNSSQQNTHPKISILVPIYNVEKYLRECLDTILTQTLSDFEVICINDGSTDSSRQIIQEYMDADSRFRVIDKPNSGYGASMNMGLDAARGTYIAILESDDMFMPNALELLYSTAIKHDAQIVKGDFNLYWSIPEEKHKKHNVLNGCTLNSVIKAVDEPKLFYAKSSIWSCLYLREFIDDNLIRFLETPGASFQDTSFNFKVLAAAKRIVLIDEIILDYRQDNETSSVNSTEKVYCICDEYQEIDQWLDKHYHAPGSKLVGIKERTKYNNYLWNYDRITENYKLEFLKCFSDEFKESKKTGKLDFSFFEPWVEADLTMLMESPRRFKAHREGITSPGKFNTFKYYFLIGGFPLVFKILKDKIRQNKDA